MKNLEQMVSALKKFRVAAIEGTAKSLNSFFKAEGVKKHLTSAELFDLLKEENYITTDADCVYWRQELILSDEVAKSLIERAYTRMRKKSAEMRKTSIQEVESLGSMIQKRKELESELTNLNIKINNKLSEFLSSENITLEDLVSLTCV